MAKYGQADVFLLIDGYDISGDTFELTHNVEALREQSDGFGDQWVHEDYVGLKTSTISHRSFYDDAAGKTQDALVSKQGLERILTAGIEGNVQGRQAVCFPSIVNSQMNRSTVRAELQKISADYASDETYDATIVQSLAEQAGDGPTTDGSLDIGGYAENNAIIFLQMTALTLGGYDDVDVVVEHSEDDDIWVELGAFEGIDAAPFGGVLIAEGPVEQYVQVDLTWNGTGTDESATLLVAIAPHRTQPPEE